MLRKICSRGESDDTIGSFWSSGIPFSTRTMIKIMIKIIDGHIPNKINLFVNNNSKIYGLHNTTTMIRVKNAFGSTIPKIAYKTIRPSKNGTIM